MSSVTKQSAIQVVTAQPAEAEPMYSEEFLNMMKDYAYETLRRHLEKQGQPEAVSLLDNLVMLTMKPLEGQAAWVQDQILSEVIGKISQDVLKLGGRFYSSSEMIAPFM